MPEQPQDHQEILKRVLKAIGLERHDILCSSYRFTDVAIPGTGCSCVHRITMRLEEIEHLYQIRDYLTKYFPDALAYTISAFGRELDIRGTLGNIRVLQTLAQKFKDEPAGPGTLLARIEGLANFAEEYCGTSPFQARPFELDIFDTVHALKANQAENNRLWQELNKVLHPKGDGPISPSHCDLVSYVQSDLKKLAGDRDKWKALAEQAHDVISRLLNGNYNGDITRAWEFIKDYSERTK